MVLIDFASCQNVESIVENIAETGTVEEEHIGFAGGQSEQFQLFEKLKEKASEKELIDLLEHESSAVIVYAAYALMEKKLIQPSELLTKFMNDERSVSTMAGCFVSSGTVDGLVYDYYRNQQLTVEYVESEDGYHYTLNDTPELMKMDSLYLFDGYESIHYGVFYNRIYSGEYIPKIEEWAFEKHNLFALEYVFENLRIGNQEKLEKGLLKFIEKNKDNPFNQGVKKMLEQLTNNKSK